MDFRLALQVAENHFSVAAKFPDNLPAGAARRRELFGVGDDRDRVETALAFGDAP